ncbi:MFS transporter [Limnohabitans sp. 2KL-1]|jgi:BCD family chlorophyll transporter-like MFS transporter|uniref:PucC family protein n=1 Tax=Limnohabitans sp. 2KL-1 TaxID=1100699 RepID=UPI000D376EBA|nr:PucC family protein [Limnohabitans sp. 2KL-1]PUE45082.1 MFS transporter [Limnohabitans sp. 2KL-1]
MNKTKTRSSLAHMLASMGPRFLPFADAASDDLPLSRLLRLSLFQISVGMAMVMLVGTLNRVMIVELQVPATLVSLMVALPLLVAPFRALIGFRSDNHRSQLGWRRVPYIWMGSLLQFGGFSIMPFALLVLAGAGQASQAPSWVGLVGAAGAFVLVGIGMHTVQTAGLALATDLAPPERQPQVVGLMYVMQLVGMIGSALMLGHLLREYSPGQLIRVVQAVAVMTLVLNVIALWKQEPRSRMRKPGMPIEHTFAQAWQLFCQGPNTLRRLMAVGLGTMAFTMEDVLLEPYGGEILSMSVSTTTLLTANLALGGLIGFAWASRVLSRGADAYRMASWGAWVGVPAFAAVIASGPLGSAPLFALGIFLIGLGGGLFAHGTLTATMQMAPPEQTGLAMGAWGAVQASAAGVGMALGGMVRDGVALGSSSVMGYSVVYGLEILLLGLTLWAMGPLMRPVRASAISA